MKKRFLLLFIVFLLTGCGAEYTVTYENDVFTEELSIPLENLDEEEFSEALEFIGRSEKEVKYTQEDINDKKIIKQEIGKSFTDTDIINYCYNHIYVVEEDSYISIITDEKNFCADKNIVIKFKTDKEVISSNADKVKGNTYIWNDLNKEISIQISKNKKVENKFNNNVKIRAIVAVIFLIIVIPTIVIILKKNQK